MPRVVLDTNVVLSALLFPSGRLTAIREAWRSGRCLPLASPAALDELVRALAYPKFGLGDADREELLAEYLPSCEAVRLPSRLPKVPDCRDPLDAAFLQLAVAGRADYLVTGDKDLIVLKDRFAVPIVQPGEFARLVSPTDDG